MQSFSREEQTWDFHLLIKLGEDGSLPNNNIFIQFHPLKMTNLCHGNVQDIIKLNILTARKKYITMK